MEIKLSQFSHVIDNDSMADVAALWQTLTMELFFVDKKLSERMSALKNIPEKIDIVRNFFPGQVEEKEAALNQLLDARILVPVIDDESEHPLILAHTMEQNPYIGVLYLMLFDGCNFSCRYCFEDVHKPLNFHPQKMSIDVAKAGLEMFARLSRNYPPPLGHEPKIQLYGGEPTLNWDVFAFTVDYFNQLKTSERIDHRIGLATVTNGTNITRKHADFIASKDVSIGVSIDGPRRLNNSYRKTKSGEDAFEIAITAIRTLREAGAKMGVSVTLTPDVVENFSEVMTFFKTEVGVDRGLGFNILHHTEAVPVGA